MEGVISLMIAAGPDSNRPPHILLLLIMSSEAHDKTATMLTTALAVLRWRWGFYMGSGRDLSTRCAAMPAPLARGNQGAKAVPAGALHRRHGGPPCARRDYKGHYVLMNLWATWCAPCVAELPALAKLQASVPGLKVLAVDVDHDKSGRGRLSSRATTPARWGPMWIPT